MNLIAKKVNTLKFYLKAYGLLFIIYIIDTFISYNLNILNTKKDFSSVLTFASILVPITFLIAFDAIKSNQQNKYSNKTHYVGVFLFAALSTLIFALLTINYLYISIIFLNYSIFVSFIILLIVLSPYT